jgi:hypothetical protein
MLSSRSCVLIALLLILSLSVTPKIELRKRISAASCFLLSFAVSTQVSLPYFGADFEIILCSSTCRSCFVFFPKCLLMHPLIYYIFVRFLPNLNCFVYCCFTPCFISVRSFSISPDLPPHIYPVYPDTIYRCLVPLIIEFCFSPFL